MAPGTETHSPASAIVRQLRDGALFSDLAASAAGVPVVCGGLRREVSARLSQREHWLLRTAPGMHGLILRRACMLVTAGNLEVAQVSAVYLPQLIPDPGVRRALWETDVPLGVALSPLGVQRQSLRAWVNSQGNVRSAGVLLLGDVPVAVAEEELLLPRLSSKAMPART